MKPYIIVVIFVLGSTMIHAQKINWVTMDEALSLQEKAPKKILIDMYTSWCGPCKMLDRNTFTNTDLIAFVNTHYYADDGHGTSCAVVEPQAFSWLDLDTENDLRNHNR